MRPATWPRTDRAGAPLLLVDPAARRWTDAHVRDLPNLLRPGELLVVNDAATLPASLAGHGPRGEALELRLAAHGTTEDVWWAVLFGTGDWRMRTEDRPPPPLLAPGDAATFGELRATVLDVSPVSPRLVQVRFDRQGVALWSALFRHGRPVQYSHLAGPLRLWHVQTAWAARPWALELPSAGWPLTAELLLELRRRGVALASLTHAAGLSSTGDAALDAVLPLPERFEIPSETVEAIARAKSAGARVLAVGTTVVRALEGAAQANGGTLRAGTGVTELRVDAAFQPRIADAILTGLHEPDTSHYRLLTAFAPEELLRTSFAHAEAAGYLGHEYGDSTLILAADPPEERAQAARGKRREGREGPRRYGRGTGSVHVYGARERAEARAGGRCHAAG